MCSIMLILQKYCFHVKIYLGYLGLSNVSLKVICVSNSFFSNVVTRKFKIMYMAQACESYYFSVKQP